MSTEPIKRLLPLHPSQKTKQQQVPRVSTRWQDWDQRCPHSTSRTPLRLETRNTDAPHNRRTKSRLRIRARPVALVSPCSSSNRPCDNFCVDVSHQSASADGLRQRKRKLAARVLLVTRH